MMPTVFAPEDTELSDYERMMNLKAAMAAPEDISPLFAKLGSGIVVSPPNNEAVAVSIEATPAGLLSGLPFDLMLIE